LGIGEMTAVSPIESVLPQTVRGANPLRAGESLDASLFHKLRARAVLEGCKWDPQVGDAATLASFPLLMPRREWQKLERWSEQLTAEALAAEAEILDAQPDLLHLLGLPRAVRKVLCADTPLSPSAARWMRFDFHFTFDGWRISEANSDVPGGFTESSFFTELMAEYVTGGSTTGNLAASWADAMREVCGPNGVIALLAASGYMEDQQIIAYMSRLLRTRGCATRLAHPAQIIWRNGKAAIASGNAYQPLAAMVRFFQAEWLTSLPSHSDWRNFFRGGQTPVANPGIAVITESKRFPLTWPHLKSPMATWRSLLPDTRAPRDAPWRSDDGWLLKTALCNTGDTVSIRSRMSSAQWRRVEWDVFFRRNSWVAQRRFNTLPIETPMDSMYPCIGVYTLNGRACGAYARLARTEVVDFSAMDVALLVEE
jgi:glutathionylspermidine synthase